MRRVLVVGCGGAGKSVLATELGERTGLPVVRLDHLYWRPGWVEPSRAEWMAQLRPVLDREAWILDGNYGGTLEFRLSFADTCVWLDLHTLTCVAGILRRRFGRRVDPIPGCRERIDWSFIRYTATFRRRQRPVLLSRIGEFERRGGRIVVLRSHAAARSFLDGVGVAPTIECVSGSG